MQRALLILALVLLSFCSGLGGIVAYSQWQEWVALQTLVPQVIQLLNAHEQALQRITGHPSVPAPPGPAPAQ